MEEFKEEQKNFYIKQADKIDAYLLRIVERYFDLGQLNKTKFIESVIAEAMLRYKASLNYKDKGVRSFNGQEGFVHYSLLSLNCEPVIIKKQAFNKDFGIDPDTICSGDDERLSDIREALEHNHLLKDVSGLPEELLDLNRKAARFGFHRHTNKEIIDKLRTTRDQIDLQEIEAARFDLLQKINILNQKLAQLSQLKTQYEYQYETFLARIKDSEGGNS